MPMLLPQDDSYGTRGGNLAPSNSSNGLILLFDSYFRKGNSSFIVYDPSNADYITLPIAPSLVEKVLYMALPLILTLSTLTLLLRSLLMTVVLYE
jgi:hypothetical protein